jgi:hypothetical protein
MRSSVRVGDGAVSAGEADCEEEKRERNAAHAKYR